MARVSRKEREQKKQDEAKRRLAELEFASVVEHVNDGPPIVCGDSGCIIARRSGQCTNGGCRCDERALLPCEPLTMPQGFVFYEQDQNMLRVWSEIRLSQ